jgi:carbamate kinase
MPRTNINPAHGPYDHVRGIDGLRMVITHGNQLQIGSIPSCNHTAPSVDATDVRVACARPDAP